MRRAALLLLVTMLTMTAQTAWAQGYNYIDANGTTHNTATDGITVTEINSSNMPTTLNDGWYVVTEDVTYTNTIYIDGDATIILANGKTMNVGTSEAPISGSGIYYTSDNSALTIYGQSLNDATAGTLNIYVTGTNHFCIWIYKSYTQHSGNVYASGSWAAISTHTSFTMNGGKLEAISSDYKAVSAYDDISINGGTVIANGKKYGLETDLDITINGGTVIANGAVSGIETEGNITINGGKVTATGTGTGTTRGIDADGTITLGWTRATDFIKASSYSGSTVKVANGQTFLTDDEPAQQVSGIISDMSLINGKKLSPDLSSAISVSSDGNTYIINNAAGWNMFCDMLADNARGFFTGKTVMLGNNITVTRMAGGRPFTGTFDGDSHTLTLNYGTAGAPVNEQFVAPFVDTSADGDHQPVFRNLTIDGNIYDNYSGSEAHNVGGLIGHLYGDVTIEHCTSNLTITSVGGAGGFVGLCEHTAMFTDCVSSAVITSPGGNNSGFVSWSRASGHAISFEGCVFNGKLLQQNGEGSSNGCFIGWTGSNKTVTITNCLCAPAATTSGETMATYNSATFARGWNATTTATNNYYTQAFGGTQGKQARSITAGEYVTVGHAGEATEYTVSGIKAYKATDANGDSDPFIAGITYNNKVYAGEDDEVSLELSNTPPTGYVFNYYTVSPDEAWLNEDGGNYTLTMPDVDVTVGADFSMQTTTETKALAAGWNWFSTYCDITLDDLKAALVEALPGTNITIRSKTQSTTYNGGRWTRFLSLNVAQMYMIQVNADCEITLEGLPIDPAEHPVTIAEGDNWIGFPFAQSMSVANAFEGFAEEGDVIISQTASACYSNGTWKGTLKNLEPGQGYIYKSAASGDRTFTYPIGGGADSGSNDSFNGESHWEDFNYHDFMYNRPFVAAIKIDGQYVTAADNSSGDMEVAAFVYGECRGNRFTLTNRYVENGGEQYPVMGGMPVYYDTSGQEVSFKLYANGIEYTDCEMLYDGDPLPIFTGEDHVEGWMDPEIPIILSFTSPAVDLVLSDTGANAEAIEQNNNRRANVTLQGRTLWKDGDWNTLCLPFDVTIAGSVLEGADVRALDTNPTGYDHATGLDGNTLYLNFTAVGAVTEIKAGTPYIIKWGTPNNHPDTNLIDPVFQGVTVSNTTPTEVTFTGGAFKGSYNYLKWAAGTEYPSILLLGTGSALFWPDGSDDSTLGAFRAYFELTDGQQAREFVLNFGDEQTTRIVDNKRETITNNQWYTLDGRKLDAKPTKKGVYINNGKKVVVK
jgi:hypothetical protein